MNATREGWTMGLRWAEDLRDECAEKRDHFLATNQPALARYACELRIRLIVLCQEAEREVARLAAAG